MVTCFIKVRVEDFDTWKSNYDSAVDVVKAGGARDSKIYRDSADGNIVIVTHNFADLEAAQAYMKADDIKQAMANGGVSEMQALWFADVVQ